MGEADAHGRLVATLLHAAVVDHLAAVACPQLVEGGIEALVFFDSGSPLADPQGFRAEGLCPREFLLTAALRLSSSTISNEPSFSGVRGMNRYSTAKDAPWWELPEQ